MNVQPGRAGTTGLGQRLFDLSTAGHGRDEIAPTATTAGQDKNQHARASSQTFRGHINPFDKQSNRACSDDHHSHASRGDQDLFGLGILARTIVKISLRFC
jgi:hypothetical protein